MKLSIRIIRRSWTWWLERMIVRSWYVGKTSLCFAQPFLQICLAHLLYGSLHVPFFHSTPIPHKLASRGYWRCGSSHKHFGCYEQFKRLPDDHERQAMRKSRCWWRNIRTPLRTSRVHRTMPIPPPSTSTGAEVDDLTWLRKVSCNISNVITSCPAVCACMAAMRRHVLGYGSPTCWTIRML